MGCFCYFKERTRNRKQQRSVPSSTESTPTSNNTTRRSDDSALLNQISKFSGSTPSQRSLPSLYEERARNLRVFEFKDLRNATNDFSRLLKIGEGGFGGVYKGSIKPPDGKGDKTVVAVKKLNPNGLQGHKQWLAEVQFLGIVEHPNLVKLIGYCSVDGEREAERLLVYEFVPNKSLEDHLFNKAYTPLPWKTRLQIALSAAEGLTYLHEGLEVQILAYADVTWVNEPKNRRSTARFYTYFDDSSVSWMSKDYNVSYSSTMAKYCVVIYRDFKASNVLLDGEFKPKLSDFGLAREGPSAGQTHVSTAVLGTYGYAAPDYVETGHLTSRSDVWSFGVVLYEILTGRRSMERNRPRNEQKLLDWVKRFPVESTRFSTIIDPRLENKYSLKGALEIAKLANWCLSKLARDRPKMSEVVESLKRAMQHTDLEGQATPVDDHPAIDFDDEKKADQESGSESLKRRMMHLAKLREATNVSDRRRFIVMKAANPIQTVP